MSDAVLLLEPFYGGSHKQLIDVLQNFLQQSVETHVITLPAKKWHWRARTSALYFSQNIPESVQFKIIFCSSVLNLAELIALRRDLAETLKVIYFHENQLVYPIRHFKDRDFQYGYNQILSALTADIVLFNSSYNFTSFLSNIKPFFKLQPDFRPKTIDIETNIKEKSHVLYFPLEFFPLNKHVDKGNVLHIVWPHRWEHDKNPELFFEILFKLKELNLPFKVSVLGEAYQEVPEVFHKAQKELENHILNWGKLEPKSNYYECLGAGHVVVSTAKHEFFGVAMLEAVYHGCFPIACNALVYPEIYPKMCLYNTPNQLFKKLKNFCEKPYLVGVYLKEANISLEKFKASTVLPQFEKIISNSTFSHVGKQTTTSFL